LQHFVLFIHNQRGYFDAEVKAMIHHVFTAAWQSNNSKEPGAAQRVGWKKQGNLGQLS